MTPETESMIRVNQAGEYGATRIYAGQLAIMNARSPVAREIAQMAAQEERHRQTFDKMIVDRRVRPTSLIIPEFLTLNIGESSTYIRCNHHSLNQRSDN